MTTLRESAQRALEAMSSFESGTGGLYEGEFSAEIAALRAALAEPVQEPVAWMMVNETYATACERKLMWKPAKNWHPTWEAVPLYTSPPQRKPLTEDEIGKVAAPYYGTMGFRVEAFARAIEQAHGIGGQNE